MGHWLPHAHVSFVNGMLDKEKIHVYCRAIKTMSWLNITRGFIPKRDTMAYIQVCGSESRFPKRKSKEYEEEYGLILYNAT